MIEQLLLAECAIGEGEEGFKLAAGWIHPHHLLNGGEVFEQGRQAQIDARGGRFPAQEVGQGDCEDADKAVDTNCLIGPMKLRLPVQLREPRMVASSESTDSGSVMILSHPQYF